MQLQRRARRTRRGPTLLSLRAALAATASIAMPRTSDAAEIVLSGSGTFNPPKAEQLAALRADLPFSKSDLASGNWSFSARYEDSTPDAESDPHAGRYAGAIRGFRLVIGSTTLDLPADQAAIVISDGGSGFSHRESIRVEARASTPSGLLRLSWIQVNQQAKDADLRGPAGVLPSDALPPAAMVASMATASPFDRFLELRIDAATGGSRPLLYLSSSKLSVKAGPATAP